MNTFIKILACILFLGLGKVHAQTSPPANKPDVKYTGKWYQFLHWVEIGPEGLMISNGDTTGNKPYKPTLRVWKETGSDSSRLWYYDGIRWKEFVGGGGSGGGGSTEIIAGGPFTTSNVQIAYNPGTNLTPKQLIEKVWYGLKPPIATLTGGTTLELTASATVARTLNWSATRQSNTPILTSITVAGVTQSFTQPAQGATVSGTQNVNVPANTTTTYSNVVVADDGQTDTEQTSFSFLGRKYYGLVSDTTGMGTGAQNSVILAFADQPLSNTNDLTTNTGSITGVKFWVYAYPASLGDLSALAFNSIPALEAMNKQTVSFTNALGYTQNYIIYWNKQGQTIPSDITAQ